MSEPIYPGTVSSAVRELLAEGRALSIGEIAAALSIPYSQAANVVSSLRRRRHIDVKGSGVRRTRSRRSAAPVQLWGLV